MKIRLLLLLSSIFGFLIVSSCSTKKLRNRSVVKVDLHFDTLELIEQLGALNIDLVAHMNNGKTKATYGFDDNGTWSWERFIIKVENGNFLNGTLFYNPRELYEEQKSINVIITPRNYRLYTDTFKIKPIKPVEVQVFPYPYGELTTDKPIKMELAVTYENGIQLTTPQNKNNFLWKLFKLKLDTQKFSGNTLVIKSNLTNISTKENIVAVYDYDNSVSGSTTVLLDYKATKTLDFSGINGWNGDNSRRNWSIATNGNKGSKGIRGAAGSSGTNGENITVYCDLVEKSNMKLLAVKVIGNRKVEKAIINTQGGKLYIDNSGGSGGNGGNGGRGGEGAHENDNNEAAEGGDGGDGGQGGNGGNGGSVTLYMSKEAMPFLSLVVIDNSGGIAGIGGGGGRSGRGGLDDNANVLDLLFGGRLGTMGANGNSGINGNSGGPIMLKVLPKEVIRANIGLP